MTSVTTVWEIRTNLFHSSSKQTWSQSLIRHISDDRSETFQHLCDDNCWGLRRQNWQETSMYCSHHTTDYYRQWSECRDPILVTRHTDTHSTLTDLHIFQRNKSHNKTNITIVKRPFIGTNRVNWHQNVTILDFIRTRTELFSRWTGVIRWMSPFWILLQQGGGIVW